jgi:hypothetical protein
MNSEKKTLKRMLKDIQDTMVKFWNFERPGRNDIIKI